MGYIRILICRNNSSAFCERLYVSSDLVGSTFSTGKNTRKEFCDGDFDCTGFEIVTHQDLILLPGGDGISNEKKIKFCLSLNALEFSYFVYLLHTSKQYRLHAINYWCKRAQHHIPSTKSARICVSLNDPPNQVLDYLWCQRISYLVMERTELDTTMSWLSTLGGAYSALGDYFGHCAKIAGRISLRQLQIALRLGDPSTVARCKLYIALSLIQTNRFKLAQKLIEAQYQMAVNTISQDIRLVRMCRGVWSKLRYEHSRYVEKTRKERKKCKEIKIVESINEA